jgi:hypothetical protein
MEQYAHPAHSESWVLGDSESINRSQSCQGECCFALKIREGCYTFEVPINDLPYDDPQIYSPNPPWRSRIKFEKLHNMPLWNTRISEAQIFLARHLPSNTNSSDLFPFMRLPTELRLRIYELVL